MNIGDSVPDFTLYSTRQEAVSLYDELKKGPVVLLFFPAAFTGVCTTEMHTVSNDLASYEPAQVFGVSTDTLFTLAEFSKTNAFAVDLLSDHDASVADTFGCRFPGDFGPMKYSRIASRATFLIDSKGVLRYQEILDNPGLMPDLDALRAAISAVK